MRVRVQLLVHKPAVAGWCCVPDQAGCVHALEAALSNAYVVVHAMMSCLSSIAVP